MIVPLAVMDHKCEAHFFLKSIFPLFHLFFFPTYVLLSFAQTVQRGLKADVNEFCKTHTGPFNTIGVIGA